MLNGKKLSFILDTGAKNTILFGSSNSDSLVLNDQIKTKLSGLSGEPINAIISRNNRIQIKNIFGYGQKVFVILDDSFNLSLKMGKPIHGIIGYELLKNFVTDINFKTQTLRFYNTKKFKIPNSKKYQKNNLEFHKDKPYIETVSFLNDGSKHQTKLLIDTGCSDALWLFEKASTGLQITDKFFSDYLGEGISGSIKGKRSKIKSFKIGDYTFNNITAAFLDSVSTQRARSFKERDGSIGSNLLQRFRVIFDYPNKILYLKKAKSFKKDFRYNRAGLGISYHKDAKVLVIENNNKIIISDNTLADNNPLFKIDYQYKFKRLFSIYYVRENSPAGKAGLMVNDIIININDKASYEYSLNEIIGMLYADEGEIITINIERNGIPFHYEFKLKKPL
ncbi:MAG TPA: PDZ domain-containing protein [Lutibacter sp.]|nr:PDZ domain-containing protein [Lutibacter sp.]